MSFSSFRNATARGRGASAAGISPLQTTNPAEAGSVWALNRLVLAARESESGQTEAEQRERRGFGHGLNLLNHRRGAAHR